MTNNWIVGFDGSPDAEAAARWATTMAESCGGNVTSLCAWHVPLPLLAMSGRRVIDVDRVGQQAAAEVTARSVIDLIGAASDSNVSVEPRVAEGHPAQVLSAEAGQDTVVVVGRRGNSSIKHRLLGSVSQHLATHSEGPVVVVPRDWTSRTCSRIVVGFDGSDHSCAALRWALEIAPPESTVTALIAIDVAPWLGPDLALKRQPDAIAAEQRRIVEVADDVDPDRDAERVIQLHGARQALSQASAEADLLVLGPRGLSGLGRAVLGSVTTWLLNSAPCPVAVVPSGHG